MSGSLRDQLQGIYNIHRELTPELVVNEARDPDHPLHNRFEWDDALAAEAHRREQARGLIQSVKITFVKPDGGEDQIRLYHAVRKNKGRVYQPVDEIVKDDVATKILLQEMERDWKRLKARYGHLVEFQAMIAKQTAAVAKAAS